MATCSYCNNKAKLVKGDKVYPHRKDLYHLSFYYCDNGHEPAYVGCHKGTDKALGRLADSKLRKAKSMAHSYFDPLWREHGLFQTRSSAYKWLSEALDLPTNKTHIGMFDVDQCEKVRKLVNEYLEENEHLIKW